ncbi:MAG: hypothetical protein IJY96_04880 [Oscillospiraceae bacterium]|nr:hypothetical protein [Oscillospiraceae bacterium]
MNEKAKRIYLICLTAAVFFGLSIFAFLKPADEYSMAERRKLEQMPEISFKTIINGRFMEDFEDYSLDQFPMRDSFRSLKAVTALKIMGQSDSNGLYIHEGSIAAMEYPLDNASIDFAGKVFTSVYDKLLAGKVNSAHFALVPDKNFYLAEDAGALHMDYDEFYSAVAEVTPFAQHIELRDMLSIDDYYLTDTHWRQEKIVDAANAIAAELGVSLPEEYEQRLVNYPFKGVYFSQLGLNVDTEDLFCLTNEIIEDFEVFNFESNKAIPVYDTALASGADPYEMFLSGSISLLTIDNPAVTDGSHLIIFRDSFGSAIAPLLAQGYSKTTLIDIRYLQPMMLPNFVDFEGADVLFLYSSMVLNNSNTLKGMN